MTTKTELRTRLTELLLSDPNMSISTLLLDDILTLLEDTVREVIGEDGKTFLHGKEVFDDDKVEFDFDTDNIPEIMLFIQENGKNVLRAEQRQRLVELKEQPRASSRQAERSPNTNNGEESR